MSVEASCEVPARKKHSLLQALLQAAQKFPVFPEFVEQFLSFLKTIKWP
jgi:hypothetical protein